MKHDIAFLHTSPVHIPTFERLTREAAPNLQTTYRVHEELLTKAQSNGVADPKLIKSVHDAMHEAASTGASVVVCTCSTIGGIAETMKTGGAFIANRIDRAMADRAVITGQPILLVAALESTLAPTLSLLQSSSERLGKVCSIESLVLPEAWEYFRTGDPAQYRDTIVQRVLQVASSTCTVVLAQASMAPAETELAKRGITALSSPKIGVESAVQEYYKLHCVV